LAKLVASNSNLSAQELVSAVRQAVYEFSAGRPPADDTTIVALKIG
jgi:serine phosphatase RsbU (regulator of sigma subunit)